MAKYVKHMLCLGGGPGPRRFQQSSQFIFTLYNSEMKRKIGGVAYVAQKKNLDGSPEVLEQTPNISDMNNLLHYLTPPNSGFSTGYGNDSCYSSSSLDYTKHNEKEMQKLVRRLIPYSQSLQGSAPHIAYERTKLMAMIPSPIINKFGSWRLQDYMRADSLKLFTPLLLTAVIFHGLRELRRWVILDFIFLRAYVFLMSSVFCLNFHR